MSTEPVRIFCGADRSQRLPFLVLADSIRRHSALPVDIRAIDNGDAPRVDDPRCAPYTEFSFARFAIPALCGYRGRAIYLDSDMLVFADIGEIWNVDMQGAAVAIEHGSYGDAARKGRATRHAAVMLLDCERLDWDIAGIVGRLGKQFDYSALMTVDPLLQPGQMRELIPRGWNDLDRYDPVQTRLLHYTEIQTQPWVHAQHPHGARWVQALARLLETGQIDADAIHDDVAQAYLRPSLLVELGLAAGADPASPPSLAEYDAALGFVAHQRLLDRFRQRKRAIARQQRDQARGPKALWERLRYRYRYGSSD